MENTRPTDDTSEVRGSQLAPWLTLLAGAALVGFGAVIGVLCTSWRLQDLSVRAGLGPGTLGTIASGAAVVLSVLGLAFTVVAAAKLIPRAGSLESRIANASVALGAVAVFFVAADRISAYFWPIHRSSFERRFPADITRRPTPYTMFTGRAHSSIGANERLNSGGYRGPLPTADKVDGEYRVLVFGGSTVFQGSPPLPALLERHFSADGYSRVRVFNFGVVSSVSGQELARLVFEGVDHQPDLVIAYGGANDIHQPFTWDPRPGYPMNFVVFENHPLLSSDGSYPALSLFAYGSHLARMVGAGWFLESFAPLAPLRAEVRWGTPEWREAIVTRYFEHLEKSRRVAAAFGADFLAVFQPMLFYRSRPSPEEQALLAPIEALGEHCQDVRERVRARALRLRRDQALAFIDMSDALDEIPETVYTDYVHITEAAREVMAGKIYRALWDQRDLGLEAAASRGNTDLAAPSR